MTYTITRLLTHTPLHTLIHTYTRTHTLTHTHLHKWPHLLRLSLCTTTSWSGCAIRDSGSVLQCVAVCCSVLQCVAVCCSVLQCVAVCCSETPDVMMCWQAVIMSWKALLWCLENCCYSCRDAMSAFRHIRQVTSEMWCDIRDVMSVLQDMMIFFQKSWNALWCLEMRHEVLKLFMISWNALLSCLEKCYDVLKSAFDVLIAETL